VSPGLAPLAEPPRSGGERPGIILNLQNCISKEDLHPSFKKIDGIIDLQNALVADIKTMIDKNFHTLYSQ
jgi:hypothetical protein